MKLINTHKTQCECFGCFIKTQPLEIREELDALRKAVEAQIELISRMDIFNAKKKTL